MNNYGKETKNYAANLISIKYEIFDHLIFPLSIKIDDNSIIQLFRKLHIMSTVDYKITYEEWLEQSTCNLLGFTEKEAKILFDTFKIYSYESDLEPKTNVQNSRYENNNKSNETVDVRYFGLFFALQLFYQRSKLYFNIDTRDKNPYSINLNSLASPMSSPRGKGASSSRTVGNQEIQLIFNYIKNNLKLFLRLVASDIHNTETSLNSNEFNTLKFFFRISNEQKEFKEINSKFNNKTNLSTLSSMAPFFVNSSTTKINIEILNEWLNNLMYNMPGGINNNNLISFNLATSYSALDGHDDYISLKNLSKCVTIKENINNKHLKISQCEDSYIYINSNVQTAKISNCNNCTIFIGSVTKITTIDKCENCNFTIATNLLRVSNSIDSTIFTYTPNQIILLGDNRALVIAPHNVYYSDIMNLIKISKLPTTNINIGNVVLFNENENESESICYQIMKPNEFYTLTVPFNVDKQNYLPLTPKEYSDVVKERENKMQIVKSLIKDANLGEEQEKALHVAIQGYFREWLVSSGNIKSMTEIVKMIDVTYSNTTGQQRSNFNEDK